MKPKKITRTEIDRSISSTEDEFSGDNSYDRSMQEKSAAYYERSWKQRKKDRQGDFWIAVGLYLITCSIAFVVI
jgi:vacuolar-type H+-ATPase catalytic subunit A/Vma1